MQLKFSHRCVDHVTPGHVLGRDLAQLSVKMSIGTSRQPCVTYSCTTTLTADALRCRWNTHQAHTCGCVISRSARCPSKIICRIGPENGLVSEVYSCLRSIIIINSYAFSTPELATLHSHSLTVIRMQPAAAHVQ